jgi:hypothetical protein
MSEIAKKMEFLNYDGCFWDKSWETRTDKDEIIAKRRKLLNGKYKWAKSISPQRILHGSNYCKIFKTEYQTGCGTDTHYGKIIIFTNQYEKVFNIKNYKWTEMAYDNFD